MKFSVIGSQTSAFSLMRQIHEAPQHQLGPCCLTGALADQIAGSHLPVELESQPENAMLAPQVGVVVLAMEDPEHILQLTRAASQSDRHVVVFLPDTASTALSFELHLLLDESHHSIIPILGRFHLADLPPDQIRLHDQMGRDDAPLLQVRVDCSMGALQSPGALKASTIRMLDLPGALGLRYSQLTAIEATAPDGTLISRLLTLGCSAASEQKLPPATITFHGGFQRSGESVAGQEDTVQMTTVDGNQWTLLLLADPPLLPRIEWACADRQRCVPWMEALSTTMELHDAVEKSLRRRRTVDIYFDSGSERGVFKSQMTAIGCGVLTWILLGMIGFLAIARISNLPPWILYTARSLWILPVVLFLAAQLLLPFTRDRASHKR